MGSLAKNEIEIFIQKLAELIDYPISLYLLGGSALCFLGNPRRTTDVDLTFPDTQSEIKKQIEFLADELKIEVEIVPIEEFIPLPDGAEQRHHKVGQYGSIEVYTYDPYSIALSKLARGFETDIQDVLFLINGGWIEIAKLEQMVEASLPMAWEFDIDPSDLKMYLDAVKHLI
jgi:hypothetical protein